MQKNCLQCQEIIFKKVNRSLKDWNTKTKFCNKVCADNYKLGKSITNSGQFKKGTISFVPLEKRLRGEQNNMWKGGRLTLQCKTCQKEYQVDQYRKTSKNCSQTCNRIYRQTAEYRLNLSKIQRDALPEHQKGLTKLLTDFRQIVRESARYKIWRSEIMKRDKYLCQICNIKGKKLCVDHIKSFAEIIRDDNIKSYDDAQNNDNLWDTTNGRTLCYDCHKTTPSYGWKALKLLNK